MRNKLQILLAAGRDVLCGAGAAALAGFYAAERSWLWLLPASAILAAAAWCAWQLERARFGRRSNVQAGQSAERAALRRLRSAVDSLSRVGGGGVRGGDVVVHPRGNQPRKVIRAGEADRVRRERMRSRFVRFDDDGNEIRKWEPEDTLE